MWLVGAIVTFLAVTSTEMRETGTTIVKVVLGVKAKSTARKKERESEIDRSEDMEGMRIPTHTETTAAKAAKMKGTISETAEGRG